jgi:hypothetical protein
MIKGARVKDPSFKWRRLWNKGNRITGMNNKGNWFSDTDNGRSDSNRSGPRHDDLCEMEEKSCWKSPKTIKSTSECDRGGYATAGAGSWLPETEACALTRGYDGGAWVSRAEKGAACVSECDGRKTTVMLAGGLCGGLWWWTVEGRTETRPTGYSTVGKGWTTSDTHCNTLERR